MGLGLGLGLGLRVGCLALRVVDRDHESVAEDVSWRAAARVQRAEPGLREHAQIESTDGRWGLGRSGWS